VIEPLEELWGIEVAQSFPHKPERQGPMDRHNLLEDHDAALVDSAEIALQGSLCHAANVPILIPNLTRWPLIDRLNFSNGVETTHWQCGVNPDTRPRRNTNRPPTKLNAFLSAE
jgi:hypothetical protein